MAVEWRTSTNGKANMGFVEDLAAEAEVTVNAASGEIWKIINIFQEGSLEFTWVDVDGNKTTFRTTEDQADSLEYLNWQIQDLTGGWLSIKNKNAAAKSIMIDTIVWG